MTSEKPNHLFLNRIQTEELNGEKCFISGQYDAKSLAKVLLEKWLPYQECHHCKRWKTCTFGAPTHPINPLRAQDGPCGFAREALINFFERTFHLIRKASQKQTQSYIDGAFALCQFVIEAEPALAELVSTDRLDFYGQHAPMVFGKLAHLRLHLDSMASNFSAFTPFHVEKDVILCEGRTECTFIRALQRSNLAVLTHWRIESYDGRENGTFDKLYDLVRFFERNAYRIYIQGDADGKTPVFEEAKRRGLINKDRTFAFDYDFESSIPPHMLWLAIDKAMDPSPISFSEFMAAFVSREEATGPVSEFLKSEFQLDIKSFKLDIAEHVGDSLSSTSFWDSKQFLETELGRFVKFLMGSVD